MHQGLMHQGLPSGRNRGFQQGMGRSPKDTPGADMVHTRDLVVFRKRMGRADETHPGLRVCASLWVLTPHSSLLLAGLHLLPSSDNLFNVVDVLFLIDRMCVGDVVAGPRVVLQWVGGGGGATQSGRGGSSWTQGSSAVGGGGAGVREPSGPSGGRKVVGGGGEGRRKVGAGEHGGRRVVGALRGGRGQGCGMCGPQAVPPRGQGAPIGSTAETHRLDGACAR